MAGKPEPVEIVRVYELEPSQAGFRVLADRLWPRGVKKETLHLDCWAKELAPSHELRKWFQHDPEKWGLFKQRYLQELAPKHELLRQLVNEAENRPILLLYAARDGVHNHVVILQKLLSNLRA